MVDKYQILNEKHDMDWITILYIHNIYISYTASVSQEWSGGKTL